MHPRRDSIVLNVYVAGRQRIGVPDSRVPPTRIQKSGILLGAAAQPYSPISRQQGCSAEHLVSPLAEEKIQQVQ